MNDNKEIQKEKEKVEIELLNIRSKLLVIKNIDENLFGYKDIPVEVLELLSGIKLISGENLNSLDNILRFLYKLD